MGKLLRRRRSPRIPRQRCLTLLEGRGRRRRRSFRDDGPAQHPGRRRRSMSRRGTTHYARQLRRNMGRRIDRLNRRHLIRRYPQPTLLYRLRVGEPILGDGHHGARRRMVHVAPYRHGLRSLVIVVGIGDVGVVNHRGVGDVHAGNIRGAGIIGREVHIPRTQREPSHRGPSAADRKRKSGAGPKTHPRYQRGRVHGRCGNRTCAQPHPPLY